MTLKQALTYAVMAGLLSGVALLDFAVLAIFSTGKISQAVTNPAFRSFFPDLFVAGFTGVVVGAILNFIQKHRLRQEMQYDWELARLMLLDRLNVFTFAPSLDDLGHLGTIDRFPEIARRYPLGRWARELRYPEFEHLHDLERLVETTAEIGTHLTKTARMFALLHKMPSGTTNVSAGLILNTDEATLKLATGLGAGYPTVRAIAEILNGFPDMVDATPVYRARLERCKDLALELREELRKERVTNLWT